MAGCLGTLGLFGRDFDPDLVGPMVTLIPHTVVFGENQITDTSKKQLSSLFKYECSQNSSSKATEIFKVCQFMDPEISPLRVSEAKKNNSGAINLAWCNFCTQKL